MRALAKPLSVAVLGLGLVLTMSIATSGCHRRAKNARDMADDGTNADFTPYSAVRSEPSTNQAVRIYEGDKSTLKESGASYVGELDVDAEETVARGRKRRKMVDPLAARAAREAAKVGATHFILLESGVDVREYTLQNAREETRTQSGYDQNGVRTTQSVTERTPAQQVHTETPRARFALFRVDPSRWHELPDALRPPSLSPESTATTRTTSGSAPGH